MMSILLSFLFSSFLFGIDFFSPFFSFIILALMTKPG